MTEAKIINDMSGNYLVFVSGQSVYSGYEMKMFEYNDIKGFLPVEISRMNNSVNYQYRIREYQTLAQKYEKDLITLENLKEIFVEILAVQQRAAEFLLSMDAIILNPEYIFTSGTEYYFCYYPGNESSFYRGIRELMEYVLQQLDHSNQNDTLMAYGIYQKILKSNFTLESLLEELYPKNLQMVAPVVEKKKVEQIEVPRQREELPRVEFSKGREIDDLELELVGVDSTTSKKTKKAKSKSDKSNKKRKLLSFGLGKKKKTYMEDAQSSPATILLAESTPYEASSSNGKMNNTRTLVGQRDNADIVMSTFPAHIGNLLGKANYPIDNAMISRDHAVITYECGVYYIEDQGSTNGTFVNGSRLSPYEPIQIRDGDIVELANERYCFS